MISTSSRSECMQLMGLPKLSLSLNFTLALSGSSPFILCMGVSMRKGKKKAEPFRHRSGCLIAL